MTAVIKNGFINVDVRVIIPWYIKTDTDENSTPIPKEDAKIMEARPSRADFANKV
jgi:hypothetical protein